MVSHIDDEGFLRVVPVGGWFDQTILGQRVAHPHPRRQAITGVVGSRPPHLMDAEDRKKMIKLKDMFIDCGARSAAEAEEMGVEIGSPVTIDRTLRPLGNDLVTGKAFDNRAGVAMMVAALRLLKEQDGPGHHPGRRHRAGRGGPQGRPHQRLRARPRRGHRHRRHHPR